LYPPGEDWDKKKQRIREQSPYGQIPNWNLHAVIIKFGDDCRQEQLAIQLMTQFQKNFSGSQTPSLSSSISHFGYFCNSWDD